MLTQRTFSIEELTKIDIKWFTEDEKLSCMSLLEHEKAKIASYLQSEATKKIALDKLIDTLALSLPLV
jgi:hypothetical protein